MFWQVICRESVFRGHDGTFQLVHVKLWWGRFDLVLCLDGFTIVDGMCAGRSCLSDGGQKGIACVSRLLFDLGLMRCCIGAI